MKSCLIVGRAACMFCFGVSSFDWEYIYLNSKYTQIFIDVKKKNIFIY